MTETHQVYLKIAISSHEVSVCHVRDFHRHSNCISTSPPLPFYQLVSTSFLSLFSSFIFFTTTTTT